MSEYSYDLSRVLSIVHKEEGSYSQTAELILHNRDGLLTSLDFKGKKGVLSYGLLTLEDEEYKDTAPLWVISQQFESAPGELVCRLELVGIPNLMAEDKASTSYIPLATDTKTVKILLSEIITATLACYSHCKAYQVVFDSEDSLINTFCPKDSFRIYTNGSRLAAIRRLLDWTKCVMRAEADGKLHIFQPTTTGTDYDYQYALTTGHTFFSKALRNRLVIPNYVVVKSETDDDPQYEGYAQDTPSVTAIGEIREYHTTTLISSAQATEIATAVLSKYQLWAEVGSAEVPMNMFAQVFDYVKVTDERENDYRVGNIGTLTRIYKSGQYNLKFTFGGWTSVRNLLNELETNSDVGSNFNKLQAKDAYIENLLVKNIDAYWIDPDGNIDLDKIGDTLDHLPDGEVYARVKTMHLDAGQLKLDENILYKSGYNPTSKFDLGTNTLDNIPEGAVYRRVRSNALTAYGMVLLDQVTIGTYGLVLNADISAGHIKLSSCEGTFDNITNGITYNKVLATDIQAGHIKLTSQTVKSGLWYSEAGVNINAATGIEIYGPGTAFITRPYAGGPIQCYVGSDGKLYAGAGAVSLDTTGITIKGAKLKIQTTGGADQVIVDSSGRLTAGAGAVILDASGIEITGKTINFRYGGATKGNISGDSSGLLIDGYNRIWLAPFGAGDKIYVRSSTSSPGGHLDCTDAIALLLPRKAWASTVYGNIAVDTDGSLYVYRPDGGGWRHIS